MTLELIPLNSEQIAKYHEKIDSLKVFLEKGINLRQLVTYNLIEAAAAAVGGKTQLIHHIIADHKENRELWERDLTDEEKTEFELMEKEERDEMIGDFTPPESVYSVWKDRKEMARWLYLKAEESDEQFDDLFEDLMMHGYDKLIGKMDGERVEVWRRCSFEESEKVII